MFCVRCRLCSLAHHAKQETEDATMTKKSIKQEPVISKEEEDGGGKLPNTTEENSVDAEPSFGKCPGGFSSVAAGWF